MYLQDEFQTVAEKCNASNAAAVGAFRTSKLVFFFAQGSLSSFPSLIIFDLSAASDSIAHAILLLHHSSHPSTTVLTVLLQPHYLETLLLSNASSPPRLCPLLKLLNLVWSFFLPSSCFLNHGQKKIMEI